MRKRKSQPINEERITKHKWEKYSINIHYSIYQYQPNIMQFIFQIFVIENRIFLSLKTISYHKKSGNCLAIINMPKTTLTISPFGFLMVKQFQTQKRITPPAKHLGVLLPLHVRTNINNKPNTWLPLHEIAQENILPLFGYHKIIWVQIFSPCLAIIKVKE